MWKYNFNDISVHYNSIPIVDNVSASVGPGEMLGALVSQEVGPAAPHSIPFHSIAILGPSGSGKSTLLDCLAARVPANLSVEGNISYGSNTIPAASGQCTLAAYVPQEDSGLVGALTVRKNLLYAAYLRMPSTSKASDYNNMVDTVLKDLGLTGQANLVVGRLFKKHISGGQKRRLSLGLELTGSPQVLLLDEVTSGLDSAAAYSVMKAVKRLCKLYSMRIVLTIHQPSSQLMDLFDSVLFLSKGRAAHYGKTSDLPSWLRSIGHPCPLHVSPQDYIISALNDSFYDRDSDLDLQVIQDAIWRSSSTKPAPQHIRSPSEYMPSSTSSKALPGNLHQIWTMTRRNLENNAVDPAPFWIRIAINLSVSLFAGCVWLRLSETDSNIGTVLGSTFFLCLGCGFNGLTAIVTTLSFRNLFIHEYLNGVAKPFPFFCSILFSSIPFLALQALIIVPGPYWLIGLLPSAPAYFTFVLILFFATLVPELFVTCCTYVMRDKVSANSLGVMLFGVLMIMSGRFSPPDNYTQFWKWLYHANLYKYTNESIMISQYQGQRVLCIENSPDCIDGYLDFGAIQSRFDLHLERLSTGLLALLAITGVACVALAILITLLGLECRGKLPSLRKLWKRRAKAPEQDASLEFAEKQLLPGEGTICLYTV